MIWERLIKWEQDTIRLLNKELMEYDEPGMDRFNKPGWTNRTWKNEFIRRAHVDVVDVRETKGLWMAHVCLFPELTNGGPIYGFDIIAGKKKVTGAFHDFSPLLKKEHPMTNWFVDDVKHFKPSKERELPDWAKAIFSPGMIAAGNITEEDELKQICDISQGTLNHYLRHKHTLFGPSYMHQKNALTEQLAMARQQQAQNKYLQIFGNFLAMPVHY